MDLALLQMFHAVYQAGSFAPVAKARTVAPSSISRGIATLEDSLGARLFHRTTRRLTPTAFWPWRSKWPPSCLS
ncbi:MAG: LysR family transcriptional regulator [Rhodospirillaceae bacterium]